MDTLLGFSSCYQVKQKSYYMRFFVLFHTFRQDYNWEVGLLFLCTTARISKVCRNCQRLLLLLLVQSFNIEVHSYPSHRYVLFGLYLFEVELRGRPKNNAIELLPLKYLLNCLLLLFSVQLCMKCRTNIKNLFFDTVSPKPTRGS